MENETTYILCNNPLEGDVVIVSKGLTTILQSSIQRKEMEFTKDWKGKPVLVYIRNVDITTLDQQVLQLLFRQYNKKEHYYLQHLLETVR